jgi:hypothetical protein
VEMAKLSLWLLTLAKDKPFEFLDHAIRCGDSLVGIQNLVQLRKFNLDGTGEDNSLFLQFLDPKIKEAIALRHKITEMQANTVEDVETQDRMLREANEKIERLKCAADILIAAEFAPGTAADKRAAGADAAMKVAEHFNDSDLATLRREGQKALAGQVTFHWPLEFPEVMVERGGLDCFVGNPPFMAGRDISAKVGGRYQGYLRRMMGTAVGQTDLCAYFLRRVDSLLRRPGFFGLLTTNTISEGDTGNTGLGHLLADGRVIYRAQSSFPWPGSASVFVSSTYLANTCFKGDFLLGNKVVKKINARLKATDAADSQPYRLVETEGNSFKGVDLGGTGFVLDEEEAATLLAHPIESLVIQGYFNGSDLFSSWSLAPSKFAINFSGMNLQEAERTPLALQIVRERVKPYRDTVTPKTTRERWWVYARDRGAMRDAVKGKKRVLVRSQVSNTWAFVFTAPVLVFDQKLVVFPFERGSQFAVMQSTVHFVWADAFAGSLKGDMSYTPTDCFENFPFPREYGILEVPGTTYDACRAGIMRVRREGVTAVYHRFHDSDEASADIEKLRELHVEMDNAVAAAYGWIDLDHGFHETKQGVRFTISEPARREILAHLLKLNHERYAEEIKRGLHEKKKGAAKESASKKSSGTKPAKTEATLFDDQEDD